MRHPIRHLAGNLIWTRDGRIWAVWRVEPPQYRNTTQAAKRELLQRTEALMRSLNGPAVLLSFCPQTDPDDIYQQMLAGDHQQATSDWEPEWEEACRAAADTLATYALTTRTHWLALPLPQPTARDRAAAYLHAAWSNACEGLGLPPIPISAREVEAARSLATRLGDSLPGLAIRPADPAETLWMYQRAPLRGLSEPPLIRGEAGGSQLVGGRLRGPFLAALDEVHLDEGGKSGRQLVSPFGHRYLAVTHPDFPDEPSYQAHLVLAEMPAQFTFPGAEYLEGLDDFGFPIDWAVRLVAVGRDKAEAASRRRARELAEQAVQRGDGAGNLPSDLEQAVDELADYRAQLAASASEVELQAQTVFCVWSHDQELVEAYADGLRRELAPGDYQIVRPTGGQEALYWAMLPGIPTPQMLRPYTQYLFAKDFAMAVPFAATELGDPRGGLLGIRIDSAGVAPILHDPAYGPRELHASASAGFVGELGGGKSVAMKVVLDLIVRQGGLVIVVDRTPSREWARFAGAVPGAVQVMQISADAEFSLDPLRLFPPAQAQRYTEGFLGLLLGIEPLSSQGSVLSEAIAEVLATRGGAGRTMAQLQGLLAGRGATEPLANDLGRRLAAAARLDLAAAVFDPDLPAVEVADVDTLVFTTHAIGLPSKDELASEYQLRQLSPEKRLGRAVMYVIAAIAREKAFETTRFAGVFLDECYWLTSSVEGERLALEIIRDGRKHGAAGYFGGHDPADIGSDVLSGLLGHRLLFRHRDAALAERGLTWLGLDADADLMHTVMRDLSPVDVPPTQQEERAGECLYRDARGRTGRMKVLIPDLPGYAEAIRTNPTVGEDPA